MIVCDRCMTVMVVWLSVLVVWLIICKGGMTVCVVWWLSVVVVWSPVKAVRRKVYGSCMTVRDGWMAVCSYSMFLCDGFVTVFIVVRSSALYDCLIYLYDWLSVLLLWLSMMVLVWLSVICYMAVCNGVAAAYGVFVLLLPGPIIRSQSCYYLCNITL